MTKQPVEQLITAEFLKAWNGKVDPSNFTYSFLDGKFRASPEMLEDLQAYYSLSPSFLLTELTSSPRYRDFPEFDLEVRMMPAMLRLEQSIWRLSFISSGSREVVYEKYFSMGPVVKAHINSADSL